MQKLVVPFVLLVLVGCQAIPPPQTPAHRLAAAEITFTETLRSLTFERRAGNINDAAWREIKIVARITSDALDLAQATVISGGDIEPILSEVHAAIRRLRLMKGGP